MIRCGSGEPLVLLHGVAESERVWSRVVPLLAQHHDTIALTAVGHRGGPARAGRVSVATVVDETERELDALGLQRPHLAGNSMGGWVALELARRGRASSVCAMSPAGCWQSIESHERRPTRRLSSGAHIVRMTRFVLPWMMRSPRLRRLVMRDNVEHGERLTPDEIISLVDDLLACTALEDLLRTDERLAPLDPLPCPVVLAWSACDRIFPPAINGVLARELIPAAQYVELPGVGHMPNIDDPSLVAATLLRATRLAATA